MYADPVSKTRKIYLRMDEVGDNKIVLDARVTTLFNKLDRRSGREIIKIEIETITMALTFLWERIRGRCKTAVGFFYEKLVIWS